MKMEYGYIRVSTRNQNLDRQHAAMIEAGVEERNILADKQSGKDFNRKSYNLLVGTDTTAPLLRQGDLLVIYSIDRLGRNYAEIQRQWQYITQEIKADIRVLDMPLLDTRDKGDSLDGRFAADLVLQILSYVAEKERENIRARQSQGIAIAKANGKHLGRPKMIIPDNFPDVYKEWRAGLRTTVDTYKKILNVPKSSFYKMVKMYEDTLEN
jgi:DNA invertase Pin-like site-specific DNA recombinase